ncbi:phasin [Aquibium oceanicum]|uniref:Phasin n=1 Tax=Aquibium oceanicum TaxID=1670800 RepID=A0A1L3SVB5_9HYPH|nr:phasin [Aquibium oceanicum]APH73291.1 phasin [Aquibium oceanicum]
MSKAAKTAETIEFPTFDASKATDQFRSFAEKGVEQSKEAYAKFKSNAEEGQKAVEASMETMKKAGTDLSLKSIAAMRANAEADFSYMESLLGAKSFSEVIELQTGYMRKRIEMAVDQVKDMQSASTKAVDELSKPAKDAFDKSMKELKVA